MPTQSESERNFTVRLPNDLYEQAQSIRKIMGISLASLVKEGLQIAISQKKELINTEVVDQETLSALRDYELETGVKPCNSMKKAVAHWLRLQTLNRN